MTTYDSAYLYMGRYGDRFGLLIFDEVHHLPAHGYLNAIKMFMAPFRLGLTAIFYERVDGRENLLCESLGEVVYERNITELSGVYLSDYEVIAINELQDAERIEYTECRQRYTESGKPKDPKWLENGWVKDLSRLPRNLRLVGRPSI